MRVNTEMVKWASSEWPHSGNKTSTLPVRPASPGEGEATEIKTASCGTAAHQKPMSYPSLAQWSKWKLSYTYGVVALFGFKLR